jgi:hypothetical protein
MIQRISGILVISWVSPTLSNMDSIQMHKSNTGRFIMYSGITKIYYRKTVGHVFTKPVQIEGTTQKFFSSKLFFIVVHISAARRCECM